MSAHGSSSGRWDVYLSYARPTRSLARAICKFLRAAGLRVWFDEDCVPNRQGWLYASQQAIARSRYHIVLLADSSPALWQRAEMDFADQSAVRYPHLETIPLVRPGYNEEEFSEWLSRFEPARLPEDKSKIDLALRELMARLKGTRRTAWKPGQETGNPYPGLAPYGVTNSGDFFGRDMELAEALHRLGDQPEGDYRRWLHVDGPGGVGKTSFARAGVVPAVARGAIRGALGDWKIAAFRPSADPVGSLAAALAGAFSGILRGSEVNGLLKQTGGLVDLVREHLPPDQGLLLVIDHLDDVITEASDAGRVALFDGLLAEALDDFDRRLFVVTTGRSDLGPDVFATLPRMAEVAPLKATVIELGGLSREALHDVVSCPAALRGRPWPDGLTSRIVDEAERVTGANGRLCWLLGALYDQAELDIQGSAELGGVAHGLARALDARIDALAAEDQERAHNLLAALVGGGRGRGDHPLVLPLTDAVAVAGAGPRAEQIVRKLHKGEGPGRDTPVLQIIGGEQVRLAHGLLLQDWPRLRKWVNDERIILERRADVDRAAAAWRGAGASDEDLPDGPQLALYAGQDLPAEVRGRLRATMATATRHFVEAAETRVKRIETEKANAQAAERAAAAAEVEAERTRLKRRIVMQRFVVILLVAGLVGAIAVATNIYVKISGLQDQVSVADKNRREAEGKVTAAVRAQHQAEEKKVAAEIAQRSANQARRAAEKAQAEAEGQADQITAFAMVAAEEADVLFERIPGVEGSYGRRTYGKVLVKRLEEATKKHPGNTRLLYSLGRAHLLRGQLSADGAALAAARPTLEKAVSVFEKMVKGVQAPPIEHLQGLESAYSSLARFLANPKRSAYQDVPTAQKIQAKAVATAERIAKLDGTPDNKRRLAKAYARSGLVQLAARQHDAAAAALDKSVKLSGELMPGNKDIAIEHVAARIDRGDVEMDRRAWAAAVTAYEAAATALAPVVEKAGADPAVESLRKSLRRKLKTARASVP